MKKDDGLDDDCDIKNTLPAVLGAFILSNIKRIMNNFIREINGFFVNSIYYRDTDSLYIEKKYWDVLDKANLVGEGLCQGKNDYKTGGIFYDLFLAPKIKYCLTIDDYGIIQEHKTLKGFNDSKRLLDRSQYFKMIEGEKISALLPKSWKKSFDSGIIIPTTMKFCDECNDRKMCDKCNNQINENNEFEAYLNELKRHPPNEFGYMLPYYIKKVSIFCTKSSIIYSCFLLFILYTPANFFNLSKVYVFKLRSINRQQFEHLKSLLLHVLKSF